MDYLAFQTSDSTINIDQFGHVIELYDFPAEYKTTDLVNGFKAFTSRSSSYGNILEARAHEGPRHFYHCSITEF